MSWQEKIKGEFSIQTGDGFIYVPKWKGSIKNITFNTEGFDFVGVDGTYVAREQSQGNQFPIEIYFEGSEHLDIADKFENSCRNKNLWTITHPIFGKIICQPLSLERDSTNLGITKFSGTVWESVQIKYPEFKNDYRNVIVIEEGRFITESWYVKASTLTAKLKTSLGSLNSFIAKAYTKLPAETDLAVDLKNRIRAADSTVEELLNIPGAYVESVYSLVTFVLEVEDNIVSKMNKLNDILVNIIALDDPTMAEFMSNMVIFTASNLAINTSYSKRNDVATTVGILKSMSDSINLYYEDKNYTPNYEGSLKMDYIVNITIGNVYELGLSASQERSVILEKDSNPIILCNRFYGFSDDNLDKFLNENNIQLDNMFMIKKGTKLIWYV